ncbi:MAG: hypothetical protein KKE37_05845 [Verrucomicrobia bacterium]|nr:hypothetical protein [Verrucomicrobiota bacterium]
MSSRAKTLWAILAMIPFLFLLYWIIQFAIDMPYLDEWDLVPYLQKSFEGSLTLGDLFDQHNESRILFPRLLLIPLAHLTGWNIHAEVAGIVFLAMLIFLLLAWQGLRTGMACTGHSYRWLPTCLSLLIFSVVQYEAWTFGFTIIGFMNIAAVAVGLLLLSQPVFSWPRFIGALLAGAVAMFSYSNGILYWMAGLLALLIVSREEHRFRIAPWIVWILFAAILLALFYTGYRKPSCMPPLRFFIYHPDIFLGYFFAFLGGALVNTPQIPIGVPIAVGMAGCALFGLVSLVCCFRAGRTFRGIAFWPALGTYAVLGALVVAIGRSANGIPHALESRYTTLSNLFWISTLVMTVITVAIAERAAITRKRRQGLAVLKIALWLFSAACAGLFLLSSVNLLKLWQEKHDALLAVRDELLCFTPNQSLLARSFPDPVTLKARMDFLTRHRLSMFRDKKSFEEYKPIEVRAGRIESIQKSPVPAKGFKPNDWVITGRAYDPGRRQPARAVLFVNSGGVIVARAHVNAAADFSETSWEQQLSIAKFPAGSVRLNVFTLLRDNELIVPIGVIHLDIPPPVDIQTLTPIAFVPNPSDLVGCTDHLQFAEDQVYGSGWARNPATGGPGRWIIVTDEAQQILAYAAVGEDRDDVARQLGNPGLIKSGWRVAFHQSRLSPGTHLLTTWLFLPDEHKALQLQNAFTVTVP